MKYSISQENYLKAIYHLQQQEGVVTTNALAGELQARPASITGMLKKLKEQKLLIYERYKGFRLSAEGKRIALQIIRKHRLWEFFLVEKLGFGWDQVHSIAEELEHISSTELTERLDAYLRFPKWDPHGDPIPDRSGKMASVPGMPLAEFPLNRRAVVCSVSDQSAALLEELADKQIALGSRLEIAKRSRYDQSLQLKIEDQIVTLSEKAAQHLIVKKDDYGTA